MTGAMHQSWCLDVKKYPTIEFSVKEVLEVKKGEGDTYTAKVAGDFLFHGVTKPLTVDATVKYLPGKLKARGGFEKDGDIVQVYSKFSVNRLDFDVAPDLSTDLIGNKIDIDLAVTGIAVR
jgi:polyisoprenoid-binding protein YceI